MIVNRLKLQDFVIFSDVDLDLSGVKLTSISGQWNTDPRRSNGAGKSALLESIPYALFGTTRSKSKSDIVRRGADKCVVEIDITANGRNIRIERQRARDGTSNARIWINGDLAGSQVRNVDAQVEQYLGLDRDLFELIYFFRQDDQFKFVNSSAGDRKGYLAKVFDLGAIEACLTLAKDKHRQASDAHQRARGAVSALREDLATLGDPVVLQGRVMDISDSLSFARIVDHSRRSYLETLPEHIKEASDLLNEFDRETADAINELNALTDEFNKNHQESASLSVNLQQDENVCQQLKQTLEQIDIKDDVFKIPIKEWESRIKDKRQEESDVIREIAVLDHTVSVHQGMVSGSKQLAGSECPTCYQTVAVDHVESLLRTCSARIKASVQARGDLAAKLALIRSKIEVYEKGKRVRENAEGSQLQAANLATSISALTKNIGISKRRIAEISSRQPKIDERRAAILNSMKIGDAAKIRNHLQCIISAFAAPIPPINTQVESLSSDLAKAEVALERYDNLKARIVVAEGDAADVKRSCDVYSSLVDIFGKNGLQAILIENVISVIEQFANDILKQMQTRFELQLRTQKENKAGDTKETLEVVIFDNGEERMFETYSGGERTLINLALRLSLSRIISSLHGVVMQSLFLDEVLAALDEVNREEAIKVVSFLSKSFQQVFMISHTDEVKDIIPGHITVRRHEEHSEVTISNG